jgi:uncharacterized protein YgiM (DUF1202 family)
MKNIFIMFVCLLFALATYADKKRPVGVKGIVTAKSLNVRVKPNTRSSLACALKRGTEITVLKKEGKWLKIEAPKESDIFVARIFVKDNTIIRDVNLRSGPSVAYTSYGIAPAGTKVEVTNNARTDWVQIAPLPMISVWVSGDYVFIEKEALAKLSPVKIEPPVKELVKAPVVEKKVKPTHVLPKDEVYPKKQDTRPPQEKNIVINVDGITAEEWDAEKIPLPFIEGAIKEVSIEGVLLPLAKDTLYVTHALAQEVNGEYFPVCYIHSKTAIPTLWLKRRIKVKGLQRWVRGWKRPIVEVQIISPTW